jgi:hypothetical protein
MRETTELPGGQPVTPSDSEPKRSARRSSSRKLLLGGGGAATVVVTGLLVGLGATPSSAAADPVVANAASVTNLSALGNGVPGSHRGRGQAKTTPWQLGAGQSLLVGTVVGVQGATLTVNRDGGGQVTVTTDSSTKIRGLGVKVLSDLKAGSRVVAKVAGSKALGVLVPPGRAGGTIISISGDQAVLAQPDGLVVNLDLSALQVKPKVGDLVMVMGQAANGGTMLKVAKLRSLPRAGS